MIQSIMASYLAEKNGKCLLEFENTNECPRCKTSIIPYAVAAAVYSPDERNYVSTVLNFCPKCKRCFITTSKSEMGSSWVSKYDGAYFKSQWVGISEPLGFQGSVFQKNVTNLSAKFVEIYNQSECAESKQLNQIAGMGYRKALEFLIKDYAIHIYADRQNEIETMFLSDCIKKYIDNDNIKTLAEKSVWLGNDETHYVKKHTDRDISDLKTFIKACANYIEMELTIEDANSITKIK